MTDCCFTYGSLMCTDIMAHVAGAALTGEAASLAGYSRHPVAEEDYPGIVADPGGCVEGVLYRGVDAAGLVRLDAFEGEMYERRQVRIELASGTTVTAWCYVFGEPYRHLLQPGEWSFETFLAAGKSRFQARYMGFAALPPA
ncbi:gamma-glutamylcyclotransferase [Parasulfuritortus cantonensis]|uniref:Putative gamma-glutamylcyclotransferase n=1 Tax=Parasulfuritortus cantonensis TaxID=2528202 RepID=A0A4V2NVK6_9PROT|nr:gamma-glutamylcyclotransferase family protein [Parasulfuritortus cantonensis]TCJ13842.1 gamma-glutamylcyclotransferase [Parasulfuritortus cantonensis]